MATRLIEWRSNTCEPPHCGFVYSYDDSLPDITPSIQLVSVVQKCPAHAALNDDLAFTTARADNVRRNTVKKELAANVPALFLSQSDADANNNAKLNAAATGLPTRVRNYINSLSSARLAEMCEASGLPVSLAGDLWPGLSFTFTWSGTGTNRIITVQCDILTTQEKAALNTFFQNNYGGKIVVA